MECNQTQDCSLIVGVHIMVLRDSSVANSYYVVLMSRDDKFEPNEAGLSSFFFYYSLLISYGIYSTQS